jgi:hypothetical protein
MIYDDTIGEIVEELRPFRTEPWPGGRIWKLAEVREAIGKAFNDVELRKPISSPAQTMKWMKAATQMLAIADKVSFPLQDRSQLEFFRDFHLRLKGRKIPGPDARYNNLAWHCGLQACVLIERYSKNDPVKTLNGNTHTIARLLYPNGHEMKEEALLWTIRNILASRGH